MIQRFSYKETLSVQQIVEATDNYGGVNSVFGGADLLWPDGAVASQGDVYYEDIGRVLGATADLDLDLTALANGPGGITVDFFDVRAILIDVTAGSGFLGGNPTNAWTALLETSGDRIVLQTGSKKRFFTVTDPGWVTGAADKILRISSGGSGMTFDILIVGTLT